MGKQKYETRIEVLDEELKKEEEPFSHLDYLIEMTEVDGSNNQKSEVDESSLDTSQLSKLGQSMLEEGQSEASKPTSEESKKVRAADPLFLVERNEKANFKLHRDQ